MCSFINGRSPLDIVPDGKVITGVILKLKQEDGDSSFVLLSDLSSKPKSLEIIKKNLKKIGKEKDIICSFKGNKEQLKSIIGFLKMSEREIAHA